LVLNFESGRASIVRRRKEELGTRAEVRKKIHCTCTHEGGRGKRKRGQRKDFPPMTRGKKRQNMGNIAYRKKKGR